MRPRHDNARPPTEADLESGMVSYMVRHIRPDLKITDQIELIRDGIPKTVAAFFKAHPHAVEEAHRTVAPDNLEGIFNALEEPLLRFCVERGVPLTKERVYDYVG